jgi:hypothetical protein
MTPGSPARWDTRGWWTVDPGNTAYLVNGQVNRYFYYYARSDGGSYVWQGSESYGTLNGQSLGMRKADAGEFIQDYTFTLTCT